MILDCKITQNRLRPVNICAMIDSGATGTFISKAFVELYGLTTRKKERPAKLTLFDGSDAGLITHQVEAVLKFNGLDQALTFDVTSMQGYQVVLGLPWLKTFNPTINWINETIIIDENRIAIAAGKLDTRSLDELVPKELLEPYRKVFSEEEARVLPPHRPEWDCHIDLIHPDTHPFKKRSLYQLTPDEEKAQEEWIDEHLQKGYIRSSRAKICASPFFVAKKDNEGKLTAIRLVIDYRYLNSISIKQDNPIPLVGDLVDKLKKSKIFTKMDLRYGYHLVRIREGDEWKTAFTTTKGLFEYTVMPLGFCNAPAVFQKMMNDIFFDMIGKGVVIYIDDILIHAETEEELTRITLEVLRRLQDHNLFIKPQKCRFKVSEVEFLGMMIYPGGTKMNPDKVKAIKEWPKPSKVKEVQKFLGTCNFYRRFIPNFSKISRPLNNLTQKDTKWEWGLKQQESFEELKKQFTLGKVLARPDPTKPFFVECNSSDFATGAVLSQEQEHGKQQPVAFYSKSLMPAERNYPIQDKELLAIIRALKQWRHYLLSTKTQVTVFSDHRSLEVFVGTKRLTPRQARWAEFLAPFNFVIKYMPGKETVKADAFSRRPDHIPTNHPERIQRIFSEEQFINAISTVLYEDEADILEGIQAVIPNDDSVKPQIDYITKTGNELDDWSWDGRLLRKAGKIFVPKDNDLFFAILHLHHDTFLGGHRGPRATEELIRRKYWWPRMAKTIEDYVKGCDLCQRINPKRHQAYGPLQPLSTPDRKWTHITYDFITGLPKCEGKDAILVVVDRFSKGAHFIPCTEKGLTGERTARLFLDNIWKLHGTPESTVSDRGIQFNNQFIKRLYELLNIKPSFSTAFHPQTDRSEEHTNQILENYLRAYVSHKQDN